MFHAVITYTAHIALLKQLEKNILLPYSWSGEGRYIIRQLKCKEVTGRRDPGDIQAGHFNLVKQKGWTEEQC